MRAATPDAASALDLHSFVLVRNNRQLAIMPPCQHRRVLHSSDSRWVRKDMRALKRQRMVGWLAFFGLAFHLFLSFGHYHEDSCHYETSCHELAYKAGFPDSDNCRTAVCPADHHSEDDCLICRTTAFLFSSSLPLPPTLALPNRAGVLKAGIVTTVIVAGRVRQAFRARAPPMLA